MGPFKAENVFGLGSGWEITEIQLLHPLLLALKMNGAMSQITQETLRRLREAFGQQSSRNRDLSPVTTRTDSANNVKDLGRRFFSRVVR